LRGGVDGQGGARDSAGYFGLRPADPRDGLAKATVAISERPRLNFDQILSKQEGTRGFGCRLRWTPPVAQLLGTTENMRYDARLPVGWNRPHNPKVAGSNPAPATMKKAGFRRTFSRRIRPCFLRLDVSDHRRTKRSGFFFGIAPRGQQIPHGHARQSRTGNRGLDVATLGGARS